VAAHVEKSERPQVDEIYSVAATGGRGLRVEADRRTAADVVIAAGMSPHRLGLAMLRLRGEWDGLAKPEPPTQKDVVALAATAPVITDDADVNKGKVAVAAKRRDGGDTTYMLPLVWAYRERQRWYDERLREAALALPSYADVHAAVTQWLGDGPDHPASVARTTIFYWLHPRCPVCMGRKKRVVEGTGRLSGKQCGECHGTGLSKLHHGGWGRRALSHIHDSMNAARKDLSAKFGHQQRAKRPTVDRERIDRAIAQAHAAQLEIGQQWQARSGTLYDVLRKNSAGCFVCDVVGGVGQGARVLYWPDGRPVGVGPRELSQGDFVKMTRPAPQKEPEQ
jgi:hypothetical protein